MVYKTSQINPDLNKSLLKTSKSVRVQDLKTPARMAREKKSVEMISHFKAGWFESDLKGSYGDDKVAEETQRQKERLYEAYLNQVIGQNKEYALNLEEQFAMEDRKDDEWIRGLWSMKYESPNEKKKTLLEAKMKVMGSKSIRKGVLGMLEYKKECVMKHVATEMGESMKKLVEVSIKKEKELQEEEVKQLIEQGVQANLE